MVAFHVCITLSIVLLLVRRSLPLTLSAPLAFAHVIAIILMFILSITIFAGASFQNFLRVFFDSQHRWMMFRADRYGLYYTYSTKYTHSFHTYMNGMNGCVCVYGAHVFWLFFTTSTFALFNQSRSIYVKHL